VSATKTLAFILKTQDYRDTSLLGDFYTRDHGRVRGIVKGIRDARARFGSTLEPFSLNEILFYKRKRGGDLHLVTQVELTNDFPKVREDLERLATASYCLELLSELVEPEEPEPRIFELLKDTLIFLSSGASCKRGGRIYEIKLLDILGLMPQINVCVMCHSQAEDPIYFNATIGGIHCRDCVMKNRALLNGSSQPVSKGTLLFLRHAQRSPLKNLYQVKVSQEVGEELEKLLRRFTDYHLSHKLKSLTFMEKIGY
jgi:DNA repair protein RecO (recombination protein O)